MQDEEALQAMSLWVDSLPPELVRRRGVHQRLRESMDALLQPSTRATKYKIIKLLVAWGQGRRHMNEQTAAASGRLCATVLRVGGELQRARNRDRPAGSCVDARGAGEGPGGLACTEAAEDKPLQCGGDVAGHPRVGSAWSCLHPAGWSEAAHKQPF